ncbi:Rieske 2Fe-2S domain-containing protein [Alteraurantiacibacter buctensis]|uniref:Rieske 2Fe-2S domain-containing protein n=1 Tax=Alteraurantiacibacter buctensis TaxID=1503981 RepID=A0A844YTA2_9SPHN|nr:Rieske 2Fe-2S domain-containing protein [Alteraurantiacibacter buctensis]
MYPFTTPTGIVRNRWYIAAFSDEITRDPIERTLLGKPVALYRRENGDPVAMYGLCPHRYYPLARGKVRGDALVCGYHGFAFEADGKCSSVPSQGTGAGFCQPTYPVIEKGPLCWIWMGDADKCDPALIPPYADFELGTPGWRYSSPNYFRVQGRAQLLVDNLMDLTHLPYVHHHISGGEAMADPKMREERRPSSYRVVRMGKLPWTHFNALVWLPENAYEGLADFDQLTDFYGPEFIRTGFPIYTRVPGHETVPPALGAMHIMHGITPETETSCHYFGFSTRNFRTESEELDAFQLASDIRIRQQDADAIEAVEARLEEGAARQRELLVKADGPAVKVRRMIQSMLDAERV